MQCHKDHIQSHCVRDPQFVEDLTHFVYYLLLIYWPHKTEAWISAVCPGSGTSDLTVMHK